MKNRQHETSHPGTVLSILRSSMLVCALVAVLLAAACSPALEAEAAGTADGKIIAIDYGSTGMVGDAVLVESKGQYILMDTGYAEKGVDIHDTKVIRYLKDHGIRDLDLYLSHYHNDHYYLLTTIMQDPFFHVGTVYLPDVTDLLQYAGPGYSTQKWYDYFTKNLCLVRPSWEQHSYTEIMQVLEETGIRSVTLSQGSSFRVGDALFEVIWHRTDGSPSGNYKAAATGLINNASLVTRVTLGGIRYLTAGDIETPVEKDMLAAGVDLRADIVKTNHHSGDTSNIEDYYRAVRPTWIFGTGSCADRLTKRAVSVSANHVNVKNNGTITFTIKDGGITMEAERHLTGADVEYKDAGGVKHTKTMWFDASQQQFFREKMLPAGSHYCEYGWKTIAGKKYLFTEDGDPVCGLYSLKGRTYYFDPVSGALQTGWFRNADGSWLCAGSDGVLKRGWYTESKKVKVSRKKYRTVTTRFYLDPETFVMATGFREIDGKKYYFDPVNGAMATGTKTIGGQTYTFESTGEIRSGWRSVKKRIKIARKKYKTVTTWYYYLPENGQAAKGPCTVDGKLYYFALKDGAMQTGWITDASDPAEKRVYYGAADGVLVTGWQTIDGKEYYFHPDAHRQPEGRAAVEGGECVFGKDGVLFARVYGSLSEVPADVNGYVCVGSALYYMKAGEAQTSWQTIGGKRYYFTPAYGGKMASGRVAIDGKNYFFDGKTGELKKNAWCEASDGTWYRTDGNGVLKTGWYKESKKVKVSKKKYKTVTTKYYLDPETGAMAAGFTEIGGKYYWFDEKSGAMATGTKTIDGVSYTFGSDGVLKGEPPASVKKAMQNVQPSGETTEAATEQTTETAAEPATEQKTAAATEAATEQTTGTAPEVTEETTTVPTTEAAAETVTRPVTEPAPETVTEPAPEPASASSAEDAGREAGE